MIHRDIKAENVFFLTSTQVFPFFSLIIYFLKSCSYLITSVSTFKSVESSVADPDPNPDPSAPYVFGPPGSGSISQRYGSGYGSGSGSGSFYHQAK
jgi:hypothetical protein